MNGNKQEPTTTIFVAVKTAVFRGSVLIARCISHTMARRIANALNRYHPTEKGY